MTDSTPNDMLAAGKQRGGETMVECRVCGHTNRERALFCDRCTAPLGVVALGDLTANDRARCRSALLSVLADLDRDRALQDHSGDSHTANSHTADNNTADEGDLSPDPLWRRYLSAFWLRPETALICYAEARALRELAPAARNRWLDLGCGDGIHSALAAGWEFSPSFDAFQSLDLNAADIYHYWESERFAVEVATPGHTIAVGCDIKDTAIERSRALGVFERVESGDATALPLGDKSVDGIFSNMLRDLGPTLPAALAECRRVLADDGRLYLSAMTPRYADHLYFAPAAQEAASRGDEDRARDLLRLDRGRSVFCRQQLSLDAWSELLSAAGLRIERTQSLVGADTIRFWDVGLRPFSVDLIRHAEEWRTRGILEAIKAPIIDLLDSVLTPLLNDRGDEDACMLLLEIAKE